MRELSVLPDGERITLSLRRSTRNVKGGKSAVARTFQFNSDRGRHITKFASDFVMSPLVRAPELHVGCMRLAAGGSVGYHQATSPQLFAVVEGSGWIASGRERKLEPIATGGAVIWDAGEWHEVGTDEGLVAIVVEGPQVGEDAGL